MLTALVFVYMIGAPISLFYIMYIEPFTPILATVFIAICWPLWVGTIVMLFIAHCCIEQYELWEKNRYYKKLNKDNQ
jgi:hypothetical protein